MKISVSNYGPIAEAKDIELCPLTVFVGPSNTGKSYLAILVYALFRAFQIEGELFSFSRFSRLCERGLLLSDFKVEKKEISLIGKSFNQEPKNVKFSDFPEELQNLVNKKMAKMVSHQFYQEILRCIGASPKKDFLTGNNFSLHFESDQEKLTLKSADAISIMKIKDSTYMEEMINDIFSSIKGKDFSKEINIKIFLENLLERIFSSYRVESFYLPAARTGIMQSHRAITDALVQRATYVGFEHVSVPALSGIVSDFLRGIIMMDTDEILDPNVAKVAKEMEKNILHGAIKTKSLKANQYPQFLYNQNDFEVPLLRSSSMVSELAPIILFLRHRVRKGDLLIIEEPESHLHPEAQRNIAKTVVHLVRVGVRVMVTTHSEYFLEQLGNYVRLSKLTKSKRDEFAGHKNCFLKEDEISAYAFKPDKDGTIVDRLHFDQENGLSPEDHDAVSSNLYNQTVEILEQLD